MAASVDISEDHHVCIVAPDVSSTLVRLSEMQQSGLYCDVMLLAKKETALEGISFTYFGLSRFATQAYGMANCCWC